MLFSHSCTPFVHNVLMYLSGKLGFDLKQHYDFHPKLAGAVERLNQTIKRTLMKVLPGCREMNCFLPSVEDSLHQADDQLSKYMSELCEARVCRVAGEGDVTLEWATQWRVLLTTPTDVTEPRDGVHTCANFVLLQVCVHWRAGSESVDAVMNKIL